MPEPVEELTPDLVAVEERLLPRLRTLPGPSPDFERRLLALARQRGEAARRHSRARQLADRTRRLGIFVARPAAAAALLLVAALVAGKNAPVPTRLVSLDRPAVAPRGSIRVLSAEGVLGQGSRPKLTGSTVAPDEPISIAPGGHLLLGLPDGQDGQVGTQLGLDGGSSGSLAFHRDARRIFLEQGRLWARVVPIATGPDPRPILVETPSGRARVLGTELALRATPGRTLVGVRHGLVRIEDRAGGSANVEAEETGLLCDELPPLARRTGAVERQFRWIGKLQPAASHPCERPTGGGPVSDDESALGRLVARLADGREQPLRLRAQEFRAEVVDGLVRVTARCTFVNHTAEALEGTFSLQLPQQASIARYRVKIGDEWVEGNVVERERARQIYEEAKARLDQPALLEWAAGNVFTAKVHPIEPAAEKSIEVSWVEELSERDGVERMILPLVSGATNETPPERLAIEVRLRGDAAQAPFRSPSHWVRASQSGPERVLRLEAANIRPRNDFVLELARPAAAAVEAWLEPGEELAPATAMVRLRPRLGNLLEEELPERVAILLDTSRSQTGTLKEVQLELLEALLQSLPPRARARVFLMHVDLQELLASEPNRAESLLAQVWANEPVGGADYARGFARLGRVLPPDWGGTLVLVGDGLPTCGVREPAELAASFARSLPAAQVRRVVTVGLGSATDAALLGRLARERAGVHVGLRPGDDLSRKLDEVLGALTRPVLTQVGVQLELPGSRELVPRRPASVRAGEALTLLARVPAAARGGEVLLSGVVNGRSFRLRTPFSFRRAPGGAGLDGLWARKRVQDLLEVGPTTKPEVLALALDHGIVTPYTSLLVLPEDKRASYAVEEQARRKERRIAELGAEVARLLQANEDREAARALEQLARLAGEDPRVRSLQREVEQRLGIAEPEDLRPTDLPEELALVPWSRSAELGLGTEERTRLPEFVRLNAKTGPSGFDSAFLEPEGDSYSGWFCMVLDKPAPTGRSFQDMWSNGPNGVGEPGAHDDVGASNDGFPGPRIETQSDLSVRREALHRSRLESKVAEKEARISDLTKKGRPYSKEELEAEARAAAEWKPHSGADPERYRDGDGREEAARALREKGEDANGEVIQTLPSEDQSAQAQLDRARLREQQGDLAGAMTDYDRALQIDPSNQSARVQRGKARHALGDIEGATEDLRAALRAQNEPDDAGRASVAALGLATGPDEATARELLRQARESGLIQKELTEPGRMTVQDAGPAAKSERLHETLDTLEEATKDGKKSNAPPRPAPKKPEPAQPAKTPPASQSPRKTREFAPTTGSKSGAAPPDPVVDGTHAHGYAWTKRGLDSNTRSSSADGDKTRPSSTTPSNGDGFDGDGGMTQISPPDAPRLGKETEGRSKAAQKDPGMPGGQPSLGGSFNGGANGDEDQDETADYELSSGGTGVVVAEEKKPVGKSKGKDTKLEIYDVRELVQNPPDYPAPELGLNLAGGQGGGGASGGALSFAEGEQEESGGVLDGEKLQELIDTRLLGEENGATVELHRGQLIVRGSPEAQANVKKLIGALQRTRTAEGRDPEKRRFDRPEIAEGQAARLLEEGLTASSSLAQPEKDLADIRKLVAGDERREVTYEHYKTTILDDANKKLQEILGQEYIATRDWDTLRDQPLQQAWEKLEKYKDIGFGRQIPAQGNARAARIGPEGRGEIPFFGSGTLGGRTDHILNGERGVPTVDRVPVVGGLFENQNRTVDMDFFADEQQAGPAPTHRVNDLRRAQLAAQAGNERAVAELQRIVPKETGTSGEKAGRTKAANNLRQLGVAQFAYSDDKRFYPHHANDAHQAPAVAAITSSLPQHRTSVEVSGADLTYVMDQLGRQVGRNILVDPNVQETVSVSLKDIPWREAVDVIARMSRCEVEERPGGVLVLTQPPKVTVQFTNANVRTVLQLLASYSGRNIVIAPEVQGPCAVDIRDMHWVEALEQVVRSAGDFVVVEETNDLLRVVPRVAFLQGGTSLAASLRQELELLEQDSAEARPTRFAQLESIAAAQPPELRAWLLGELIRWTPEDVDLHEQRGQALLELGQPGPAWRAFSGMVEAAPDSAEAHARYARALLSLGLASQALDELREAVRLAPADGQLRLELARTAVACGQARSAAQVYLELLRGDFPAEVKQHATAELRALTR